MLQDWPPSTLASFMTRSLFLASLWVSRTLRHYLLQVNNDLAITN